LHRSAILHCFLPTRFIVPRHVLPGFAFPYLLKESLLKLSHSVFRRLKNTFLNLRIILKRSFAGTDRWHAGNLDIHWSNQTLFQRGIKSRHGLSLIRDYRPSRCPLPGWLGRRGLGRCRRHAIGLSRLGPRSTGGGRRLVGGRSPA
jgi:hypothetical protein